MNNMRRYAYAIPYWLWIGLFVVAPIILIIYYSFFDIEGHFSLVNYETFFTPVYLRMTVNSFWYACLITACSLLIAYPTAYLLTKTKHKQLWLLLIILPTWVNLLLKAYAFLGLFGTYGAVNALFEAIGIGTKQLLFTDFSFVFVSVYIFIPFMILPIFNALEKLNPSLIDAARDLGASEWTTFRRVIFPLTLDGVKAGCQAVFIPSLSLFMLTRLIAGNRVITLGTAVEQHFLVTQNWGMGATIAVFLMIAMAGIMALTGNKKWGGETMKFSRLYLAFVFFVLYMPIFYLIYYSFNSGGTMHHFESFTLDWYKDVFADTRLLIIVLHTMIIALLSSSLATIIGVLGAIAIYYAKHRWKQTLLTLNNVLIVSPDVIIGASFLILFTIAGIQLGFTSVLLSHIAFSIPIVVLMVLPKLQDMSPTLIDAARDLGANEWNILTKVILPYITPGIFAGFFMALTYSLDDFAVTFFVTGNGFSTLSVEIYSRARQGISLSVNALSTLLFLFTLVLVVVYYVITQRASVGSVKKSMKSHHGLPFQGK